MTGIMEFAGIWKKRSQVFATPAYYVFKMYASADADKLVSSTANAVLTPFLTGSSACLISLRYHIWM